MKKKKLKLLVKSARSAAKKDITSDLIHGLTEIVAKYGEGSKKLTKDIEKGAKQLAKKLSKDIKIYSTTATDTKGEVQAVQAPIVEVPKPAKTVKEKTVLPEAGK